LAAIFKAVMVLDISTVLLLFITLIHDTENGPLVLTSGVEKLTWFFLSLKVIKVQNILFDIFF